MRFLKIFPVFLFLIFLCFETSFSQGVGIGTTTPNPKAMLDVGGTKGVMLPRMSTASRLALNPTPNFDIGLMVWDSDLGHFYYWDGTAWQPIPKVSETYNTFIDFDSSTNELHITDGGGTQSINIGTAISSGPFFISPVQVWNGTGAATSNFNAFNWVPTTATAIILEAEGAISGPDGGDVDGHIKIRKDATSSSYVLLRGRSAGGGDNISMAGQGTFPIRSDGNFDIVVENPGFNGGWVVRIVGYY